MVLWLSDSQARQIAEHALAEAPHEACGLIAGVGSRAQRVISLPNAAADPQHHFEMDHRAFVRAMFEIESAGQALIAIYHSHPNGHPIPSSTDITQTNYFDTIQLIVGLRRRKAELGAWRIRASRIVERAHLHIGDAAPTDLDEGDLSRAQRAAIIISALLAVALLILVSLVLLPPAPPLPG